MKSLIVYGTRYGTAAGIGKVMENEGVEVGVIDFKDLKNCDVTPYDLIIVGSGIKMGKWTKNSLKFLKDNRSILATKKGCLVCFLRCRQWRKERRRRMGELP